MTASTPTLELPAGVSMAVVASIVVAAAIAAGFALVRGVGRDPVERLAAWAADHGLAYVAPDPHSTVLATFRAQDEAWEVRVERVPRRRLADLPPRITVMTHGAPPTTPDVLVQPASWVMDTSGGALGPRVASGDADFDARWAAYGDAAAVAAVLEPGVRARLLDSDTDGLALRFDRAGVTTSHPGVVVDARELDRRHRVLAEVSRLLR